MVWPQEASYRTEGEVLRDRSRGFSPVMLPKLTIPLAESPVGPTHSAIGKVWEESHTCLEKESVGML